jgi:hypothetical protein
MGWFYPTVIKTNAGDGLSWEAEVSLTGVGGSDWIIVPDKVESVLVTVSFTGGAKGWVESTTDSLDTIKTGGVITPIVWKYGEVFVDTGTVLYPVRALRLFQTFAGGSKLTLKAV